MPPRCPCRRWRCRVHDRRPPSAQIVYDPSNYAQNVIQAARALEQINNQITSLQNQAQMLINQARNLANLPQSSLQQLQQSIQNTQQLLGQAQHIAYDVQQIDRAFSTTYGAASTSAPDHALIDGARQRWQNSVAAHQDALKVQAGVVGNLDTTRTHDVVAGDIEPVGNRRLAGSASRQPDPRLADAATRRSHRRRRRAGPRQNIEAAQRTAAQEQGREQLRRFLTPGQGYQPGNARMFQQ